MIGSTAWWILSIISRVQAMYRSRPRRSLRIKVVQDSEKKVFMSFKFFLMEIEQRPGRPGEGMAA